jgi:hypothetical protein
MKIKAFLLLLVITCLASCHIHDENDPEYKDSVDGDTPGAIWGYNFDKRVPTRLKDVNPDTLTPAKLIAIINSYNIHLDFVKISTDTIFVQIKQSTYLTQQIGTSGAYVFMSTTVYTLTELKGIKYVNFNFEEGDHARPGTYSRKDFDR